MPRESIGHGLNTDETRIQKTKSEYSIDLSPSTNALISYLLIFQGYRVPPPLCLCVRVLSVFHPWLLSLIESEWPGHSAVGRTGPTELSVAAIGHAMLHVI